MGETILQPEVLLLIGVCAPLITFLLLSAGWLAGWQPSEKAVARGTSVTFLAAAVAIFGLTWQMSGTGWQPVTARFGPWFEVGEYSFPLTLLADKISLPLLALTVVLSGLTSSFSSRYLHRDRGYLRFFALLNLFAFGAALAFAAGSFDLLIAGWEFVGLTSVLLIAFFNQRREPVRNSLRVFAVYKGTDIGLLAGVFLLDHLVGADAAHAVFHGNWQEQAGWPAATVIGGLLLLAAAGKSAQIPFSGWLPRAMEGPTPSSAIFYGAISVHLGVYLLLRAEPILQHSPVLPAAVVILGLITAMHATLAGRAATDAKTSLSYTALTQLGIVFMEVGFGFQTLALMHTIAHAIVRTLQFLRAPSMLHDDHQLHAAAGGHLARTGLHYDALLPRPVQLWLYRLALDRCHLDALLDRLFARPLVGAAQRLAALEGGTKQETSPEFEVRQITPEWVGSLDA